MTQDSCIVGRQIQNRKRTGVPAWGGGSDLVPAVQPFMIESTTQPKCLRRGTRSLLLPVPYLSTHVHAYDLNSIHAREARVICAETVFQSPPVLT